MARANSRPPTEPGIDGLLGAVARRLSGPTAQSQWGDLDVENRTALVAEAIDKGDDLWFWRNRLLGGRVGLLDRVRSALDRLDQESD